MVGKYTGGEKMIPIEEIFYVVEAINEDTMVEVQESFCTDLPYVMTLKLLTNGIVHSIQFMGCCIWQSDLDERAATDGQVIPLENYLRERMDDILLSIAELSYVENLEQETSDPDDFFDEEVEAQESDVKEDQTKKTL